MLHILRGNTSISRLRAIFLGSILFLFAFSAYGQCDLDIEISGENLICPDAQTIFSVPDSFDSYQWFRKEFSDSLWVQIPGENDPSIRLTSDDGVAYFRAEVTYDTCVIISREVLLDVYVFLLPSVSSTGNYRAGSNGEFIINEGDSLNFRLNMPYDTNIVWVRNGDTIAQNTQDIWVKDAGIYGVGGASSICPHFFQRLGVPLVVEIDQATSLDLYSASKGYFYPNPTDGPLYFKGAQSNLKSIDVINLKGHIVRQFSLASQVNLSGLSAGQYFIVGADGKGRKDSQWQIVKK